MNWIDVLLGVVMLLSLWSAWRRGFFATSADLLALMGALGCALWLYPYAVRLADSHGWSADVWTAPLAFLVIVVILRGAFAIALARALARRRAMPPGGVAIRAFGLVPGAMYGAINATVVAMLLLALPLGAPVNGSIETSKLAHALAAPADWLEAQLRPIFDPAVNRTLNRLTVTPDSHETVQLPFRVSATTERPDLEAQMLAMLNEERRAQGLPDLQNDPAATAVARSHSRDMFARGFFSHVTPESEDPFDRMRRGGLKFRAAGENLALARTLTMAHEGLMNSPGHRANILRPAFRRVGIGIMDGGRYGLMVTQNFRN